MTTYTKTTIKSFKVELNPQNANTTVIKHLEKNLERVAGEMLQWSQAFTAHAEDLGSVSSTYISDGSH